MTECPLCCRREARTFPIAARHLASLRLHKPLTKTYRAAVRSTAAYHTSVTRNVGPERSH